MTTRARGLRLPEELEEEIEREMRLRGAGFTEVATSLLREAVRMRRTPGIVYMDGATGRRAVVAGTGIDVWEIISQYREVEEDFDGLRACYPWLVGSQLASALSYYELYPEEIDARIEAEERWTPERVWDEYPVLRPDRGARPSRGA